MQMHRHISYPAPNGKRLLALFIDSFIMTIGSNLSIAISEKAGFVFLILAILFPLFYFLGFHAAIGATPGKKILGLEIVDRDTGERPSFLAIFGRESIGRILSSILMLGYLMIFFTENREGLHDKIFKTNVVTHNPPEDFSLFKAVGIASCGGAALVGAFLYIMLFTKVPLEQMAKQFEADGLHIDGITGNLKNGFSVAHISQHSEFADLEMKDVTFTYKSILEAFVNRTFRIEQISASHIQINLKKSDLTHFAGGNKATESQNGFSNKKKNKLNSVDEIGNESSPPARLEIGTIDINDVHIQNQGKEVIQFNRFYLTSLNIDKKHFELKRLWLDSNLLTADINGLVLLEKDISIESSNFLIRKGFKPDLLAGDVDFKIKGMGNLETKKGKLEFSGFKDSILAKFDGDSITVSAIKFQPHWYLQNMAPIHSINFEAKGSPMEFLFAVPFKGDYFIKGRQFRLVQSQIPGYFLAGESENGGAGKLYSAISFNYLFDPKNPIKIWLGSAQGDGLEAAMGELYFSKRDNFSSDERTILNQSQGIYIQGSILPRQPQFSPSNFSRAPAQNTR